MPFEEADWFFQDFGDKLPMVFKSQNSSQFLKVIQSIVSQLPVLTPHQKVQLNAEELDKLKCWIDLLVPYCGEYDETNIWSDQEKNWYKKQNEKRKRLANVH